jgi:rubrerythrin
MDIGAVFLILTVALLAGLFISRPFLASQPAHSPALQRTAGQDENRRSILLAEYDHYLTALQELDFDQVLGKIPEGDYPLQRQALLLTAADLLRRLEEEPQNTAVQPQDIAVQPQNFAALPIAAEDRIEAAISARRAATRLVPADNLEAMIATRRRAGQEKSNGFCPRCGKPLQKSDRFCPKCGKAL